MMKLDSGRRSAVYTSVGTMLVLTALSFLEYRVLYLIHWHYLFQNAEATITPLTGHPWWRAWQNRLLAAFVMNGIQKNMVEAYKTYTLVFCLAANVTTFFLYSKRGAGKALLYVAISVLAFLLLQDEYWLYGWDLPEAIIFTALVIGIDRNRGIAFFTALFAVAFLNRESSLFILAWVFFNAISKKNYRIALYSVALFATGIAGICLLREHLFIASYQQYVGNDPAHLTFGNHFWYRENVINFFHTWPPWKPSIDLIPAMMVFAVGYFVWRWTSLNRSEKDIVLVCCLMVASIFCFTVIHETRVWLMLIPFLLYLFEEMSESRRLLNR